MTFYDCPRNKKHYLFPNWGDWTNTWKRWHIVTSERQDFKQFGALSKGILHKSIFFWSNHYSFLVFLSNLTQKFHKHLLPCLQSYKWENPKNTIHQMKPGGMGPWTFLGATVKRHEGQATLTWSRCLWPHPSSLLSHSLFLCLYLFHPANLRHV